MVKTDVLKLSNSRSVDSLENNRQYRRRRCGIFPCSRFCWCRTCAVLLIIGLVATIAAVLALNLSKNTVTSIAAITTATVFQSSTIVTSPSATTTNFVSTTSTTSTQLTTNLILSPTSQTNWLTNGDGETGPCESGSGVTHPTGWNYNGVITQIYYNNTYGGLMYNDTGPSDRGKCYFYGQISAITSMWQTMNMTVLVDPLLIDNQTIWFNFSAWIGGYQTQNDSVQVSLTFTNQTSQPVGNTTTLGPVLAAARKSVTSLLFQQTNGLVPMGARSFTVTVTITRVTGSSNDGDVDNIAVLLYY